jgi:hypothetical protein
VTTTTLLADVPVSAVLAVRVLACAVVELMARVPLLDAATTAATTATTTATTTAVRTAWCRCYSGWTLTATTRPATTAALATAAAAAAAATGRTARGRAVRSAATTRLRGERSVCEYLHIQWRPHLTVGTITAPAPMLDIVQSPPLPTEPTFRIGVRVEQQAIPIEVRAACRFDVHDRRAQYIVRTNPFDCVRHTPRARG